MGTLKSCQHEAILLEQADSHAVQEGLEVRLATHPMARRPKDTCFAAVRPGPRKSAPCFSAKATG